MPLIASTQAGDIERATTPEIDTTDAKTIFFGLNIYHGTGAPFDLTDSYDNTWVFVAEKVTPEWMNVYRCLNPNCGPGHTFSAIASDGAFRRPAISILVFDDLVTIPETLFESTTSNSGVVTVGDGSLTLGNTLTISYLAANVTIPLYLNHVGTAANGFTTPSQLSATEALGITSRLGINSAYRYNDDADVNTVDWSMTDSAYQGGIAGILLTFTIPPPPPPNSKSGIYKLTPDKRHDTLYVEYDPVRTLNVKIP